MQNKKTSGFKSNKFKHGSLSTVFTVIFIAVIIVINIVVSILAERFPSMNIDMTAEGLNSLSEETIELAEGIDIPVEILIISPEEDVMNDVLYASSGVKYSQVANLAYKLQEVNQNISVDFVDPDLEPELVAQYTSDSLATGDVLVRSEKRYKVLEVGDLFSIQQASDGSESYRYFSKIDGAYANALHLVSLDDVPVISVALGHSEMLVEDARASFDTLLEDSGFDVNEFNILTEDVPEDTDIIMLPAPTTDYSPEEIDKLEEFLSVRQEHRSVMLTYDPRLIEMPNLDKFLAEWGIDIVEGVAAESNASMTLSGSPIAFISESVSDILADISYPNLLTTSSSPIEFTFNFNDDIVTYPLIQSSDQGFVYMDESSMEDPELNVQTTAALSQIMDTVDNQIVYTNVIVFGGSEQFVPTYMDTNAFSNRDYVVDLLRFLTGTTDEHLGIYVQMTETNILDISASYGTLVNVGLYTFTIGVPAVILIIGLVIFFRRRHL